MVPVHGLANYRSQHFRELQNTGLVTPNCTQNASAFDPNFYSITAFRVSGNPVRYDFCPVDKGRFDHYQDTEIEGVVIDSGVFGEHHILGFDHPKLYHKISNASLFSVSGRASGFYEEDISTCMRN
jgi:hypothetical protein